MTLLHDYFKQIDWWELQPTPHLVIHPANDPLKRIAAASTSDNRLAVVYLPDNPTVELDLSGMMGPLQATWFHPVTGLTVSVDHNLSNTQVKLTKPSGWTDAVLTLKTVPSSP